MPMDFRGLEVRFEINGVTYEGSLDDEITIESADLDGEFVEQARKFAWWAMLSELAKDKQAVIKNELDQLYARLDHKVRSEAAAATDPAGKSAPVKLTEKMVENSVITDPMYQKVMKEYLEAKKEYGLLSAGRDAFAQRKEMLISLGANYRMQSFDPVVNTEKARVGAQVRSEQRQKFEEQKEKARQLAKEAAEAHKDQGSRPSRVPNARQPLKRAAKEE